MAKRILTYVVLLLIAVQSVAGLADAHQSHQSGMEHLTFDEGHQHDHEAAEGGTLRHEPPSDLQEWDCHHCCHCHGHTSAALLINLLAITFQKSPPGQSTYHVSLTSKAIAPLLRPPIA